MVKVNLPKHKILSISGMLPLKWTSWQDSAYLWRAAGAVPHVKREMMLAEDSEVWCCLQIRRWRLTTASVLRKRRAVIGVTVAQWRQRWRRFLKPILRTVVSFWKQDKSWKRMELFSEDLVLSRFCQGKDVYGTEKAENMNINVKAHALNLFSFRINNTMKSFVDLKKKFSVSSKFYSTL